MAVQVAAAVAGAAVGTVTAAVGAADAVCWMTGLMVCL